MMAWAIIAFILGILIDITRSVLIPVSTDYVRSFFHLFANKIIFKKI